MLAPSPPAAASPRVDAKDTASDDKQDVIECAASAQAIVEPYERYRSIELRAECYRRGTRPIRTGAKANDNKAGYLSLLRAFDKSAASSCAAPASADSEPSLRPSESPRASKRALSPNGVDESNLDAATAAPPVTTRVDAIAAAAPAPSGGDAQDSDVKRRRTRERAYVPGASSNESESVQSLVHSAPDAPNARARAREEKELAVEYMRLKMELLRETHAMAKARRRDDKRLQLHTELQGVVTTLAQLHRVAKEHALEDKAGLLSEANDDIAFFQTRKRQIKRELLDHDDEQRR